MKRLSLLGAVSALLVVGATAAQAQVVLGSSGAGVTVAVPVTPLAGTVIIEDTGARRLPSGYNETGRLARFMGSEKLMRDDIQFRNRDFQHWYPLEARTKVKVDRILSGNPRSQNHPIVDFETGRLARFMADPSGSRLRNNVIFNNRDFEAYKPIYAPTANAIMNDRVRGLATKTNLVPNRRVAIRLDNLSASSGVGAWF